MAKYKVRIEDTFIKKNYDVACDEISIEQTSSLKFLNGDYSPTRMYMSLGTIQTLKLPLIKNVKFNDPATIVFWNDGTKTVVKCNGEVFDPEKGLAMAVCKKVLGTNKSGSNYYNVFEKWCNVEKDIADLDVFTDFIKSLVPGRKEEK